MFGSEQGAAIDHLGQAGKINGPIVHVLVLGECDFMCTPCQGILYWSSVARNTFIVMKVAV